MPRQNLGELEQVVLLALLRLGGTAHGAEVRAEILDKTGRSITPGALYPTLDRLEVRGLLRSRLRGADARARWPGPPKLHADSRRLARDSGGLAADVGACERRGRAEAGASRCVIPRALSGSARSPPCCGPITARKCWATLSKSETRVRPEASGESDRHSGWRFICSAALSQGGRRVARSMFPMARRPHRGFTGASAGI